MSSRHHSLPRISRTRHVPMTHCILHLHPLHFRGLHPQLSHHEYRERSLILRPHRPTPRIFSGGYKSTEGLLWWFIPCTIYPIIPVVPGISVSGYNESRWGREGRPTVIRMTFMTTEVMDAKSLDFMETNTMFCIVISSNS